MYTSVLGPSSLLFLRRAGRLLAEHPEGVTLDVVELSRAWASVRVPTPMMSAGTRR